MVREAPEAISGFEIRFGFFRQGMLPVRSETALPAVVAGAWNRHFAAGTGAVHISVHFPLPKRLVNFNMKIIPFVSKQKYELVFTVQNISYFF